jgi:hypothetical protein
LFADIGTGKEIAGKTPPSMLDAYSTSPHANGGMCQHAAADGGNDFGQSRSSEAVIDPISHTASRTAAIGLTGLFQKSAQDTLR